MSSVRRLLIFHASIGTAHVQTGAHFFFPPTLVWLHLTFCKIRTRFRSCNGKQQPVERTLAERVAEKRVTGGGRCVVCSVSASSPLLGYLSSALSQERGRAILVCVDRVPTHTASVLFLRASF